MSEARRQRRAYLRALDKSVAKIMKNSDVNTKEGFMEVTDALFKAKEKPVDYSAIKCACKDMNAEDCNC
jgi:hypothetical protein